MIFFFTVPSFAKIIKENGDVLHIEITTLELLVDQKIANSNFLSLTSYNIVKEVKAAKEIEKILVEHNFQCDRISTLLKKYELHIVN